MCASGFACLYDAFPTNFSFWSELICTEWKQSILPVVLTSHANTPLLFHHCRIWTLLCRVTLCFSRRSLACCMGTMQHVCSQYSSYELKMCIEYFNYCLFLCCSGWRLEWMEQMVGMWGRLLHVEDQRVHPADTWHRGQRLPRARPAVSQLYQRAVPAEWAHHPRCIHLHCLTHTSHFLWSFL